jgi:DNA-binding NarL/FixJ family response regulator
MVKTVNCPQPQDHRLRVIVVSSNHMIRVGLRMMLDAHPRISLVGELSGGSNAVEVIGQERPDVVLIDLDLADVDVLELIRKFHTAAKESRILILSGLNDEELMREALCSGAAGVVLKVQPPPVIFAAIEGLCGNAPKAFVAETMRPALKSVQPEQKNPGGAHEKSLTSLTTREREIITFIGKGCRNKDIADRLCISETTVRHHLTSIFNKLEVSNRQKLLIIAHQYGLVELKSPELV